MAQKETSTTHDARHEPGHSREHIGIKQPNDAATPNGEPVGDKSRKSQNRGRDAVSDQADGAAGPLPAR